MVNITAFFKIIRPGNAAMSGAASALGFWLSGAKGGVTALFFIIFSSACAAGYGNVINDIIDVKSDRINHPERPIPAGLMSSVQARKFMLALAILSLLSAFFVSPLHLAGCFIPIIFLTVYSLKLKATPLTGNVIVSFLVAYALVYGGLGAERFSHLIIPSALAFLLNISREIIKDMEDRQGDAAHGIITSAALPQRVLNTIVVCMAILYALIMTIPFFLSQFGIIYLIICCLVISQFHIIWTIIYLHNTSDKGHMTAASMIIKIEMLAGLSALALDRLYTTFC
jgi:geranylgeranylglycerol-phosphate geranylgeranyltransferase